MPRKFAALVEASLKKFCNEPADAVEENAGAAHQRDKNKRGEHRYSHLCDIHSFIF